jgi:methionine-gamma-lyase
MATARYHKVKIGEHELNAETLMLGYGYDPSLSEGSVKPPVFLTSTFVFQTAEQGRDFFDHLAGRRAPPVEGQTVILASIIRTWKSSRIGSRSTKKPQVGWCLPPAWRPSSL